MNYFIALLLLVASLRFAVATSGGNAQCLKYDRKVTKDLKTGEKNFVNCLGQTVESGQSELVILLDRSASMMQRSPFKGSLTSHYDIAKKFIEALLSEVRISSNATRIAIGTFADTYSREINYIWYPTNDKNRCKFEKEYKSLRWPTGMTNIRAALQDAYDIFAELDDNPDKHRYRHKSNKVVLLLSDGKGNAYKGPNPGKPWDASFEAKQLRDTHRLVYTIGVGNFEKDPMKSWASHPSAFLDVTDFSRMATLAHNIRGGKYTF